MMIDPVFQRQRIAFLVQHRQTCPAGSALLISHSHRTVIGRISIAIRRIKKIKAFAGKKHPAFFVKVAGVVFTDYCLKFTLPFSYVLMKRFCRRGKIVWLVYSLLVEINVHLWQPIIVQKNSLLGFKLRLPGPITV